MMHPQELPFKERPETVAFIWPIDQTVPDYATVQPYSVDVSIDRQSFEAVQAAIGWDVTEDQWCRLQSELVPGSMVFVRHGGEAVGVACALFRDDDWVELAWVAVSPKHRGRGLGKIVCSAVVSQLHSLGLYRIFGSTQDNRLAALKIYLDIRFHPVFRPEKLERWRSIYQKLDKPFTPRCGVGHQSKADTNR